MKEFMRIDLTHTAGHFAHAASHSWEVSFDTPCGSGCIYVNAHILDGIDSATRIRNPWRYGTSGRKKICRRDNPVTLIRRADHGRAATSAKGVITVAPAIAHY